MITTPRLLLRQWRESDLAPFAAMNADPRVMEHFPNVLTREESDAMVGRIQHFIAENGFGFWAVEIPGVTDFAGFIGLSKPKFESHFTPCVEVGWRLAVEYQGKGYATEGGKASLEFGFNELGLTEIYSFTATTNQKSEHVMQKIGMEKLGEFEHPMIAEGHRLRKHLLYVKKV